MSQRKQQTARKPVTKFAHLKRKLQRQQLEANQVKRQKRKQTTLPRHIEGEANVRVPGLRLPRE